MKKTEWKRKIRRACQDAGTYRKYFDSVIDTLAGIMETRDAASQVYEEHGSVPVIAHTNQNGAVNTVKNPELVVIMDCNTQALAYWRDLGLTPAGLKKLNEKAMKEPDKKDTFAEILAGIGA